MFKRRAQAPAQASAMIAFAGREVSCTVRELSPVDAKVWAAEPTSVPLRFELVFVETGESRPASLKWKRGNEISLEFMPERRASRRGPHG